MGTVWFIASSTRASEDLALRAIIGAAICIITILLIHVATRRNAKTTYISFIFILICIIVSSLVLLTESIQSIVSSGVAL